MRKEAEEAKAPEPPKKSLAERLREAEAQDKAEAEAKAKAKAEAEAKAKAEAKPKATLEMLMSGKVVAKDFVLPKPQAKEDKLKAEAEARRAYFADMAKKEEGSWRDILTELEKTTKRPIQFKNPEGDWAETPDNPEYSPNPESELYKLWEFRWDFCEPMAWYLGQAERKELIPIRKWIIGCLREEDILPFNTTTTKITGLFTETLRYGYGGSPLMRSIYDGHIDLPEDYPDRETVLLKAKAYAKDELLGTYAFKMGQPLRMGPPSHRAGFDTLIHTKGTTISREGMIEFMKHMPEDYRKSETAWWEQQRYEANTTEEERAEKERKEEEERKAEERKREKERADALVEARIVAEKALQKHAEGKQRLTSKCYDCDKWGGLCSPHTVDKCPARQAWYCYVCSRYGHIPRLCPNRVAMALRAGKMPSKDVKDFKLPVKSHEDVRACIVMAGEVAKEGDTQEDKVENKRLLQTICDLLEPPHGVIYLAGFFSKKEDDV